MMLKNKKGGEKYLSIWWFLVLIVIGAGIVIGVSIFNARDISIKKVESSILLSRVVNCIVENGYLKQEVLAGNFDLGNCFLSKKIIDESSKYYLAFEIYKFEDCSLQEKIECKNPVVSKSFGVLDFQNQCKIAEKTNAQYYPECEEKYIYTLNGGKMVLHIIAGSNQAGKVEAVI